MNVVALTKEVADYGGHSGYYTQVVKWAPSDRVRMTMIAPVESMWRRAAGKVFSMCIGAPTRNQAEAAAELGFLMQSRWQREAVCHITNVEDHLPLLAALRQPRPRWIGTVHFPPSHWCEEDASHLCKLGRIITLCRRDAEHIGALIGPEKVVCLLHGVDLGFFRPDPAVRSKTPRVVFVGKWRRDFETTGIVLREALERWPDLCADIVIARRWVKGTPLAELDGHPRVRWQEFVDDAELLRLYQSAWLLLLPLHETSANNAVVEALACGTVPVVNRVGGIPDYGGGDVFPMVEGSDPGAFLALMESHFSDPRLLAERSWAAHEFAVERLDWNLIRAQHRAVYEGVVGNAVGRRPS